MSGQNLVRISGKLVSREGVRWTPARLPVLELRIDHASQQTEAGAQRKVQCLLTLKAIGPVALQMDVLSLGTELVIDGFLAAKSAKNQALVLHVTTFELLEGIQNGI